ncbi:hypothetical protein NDU88_001352 [Pleurodeles waltl]|uniref:Uncharacterized protein n=1 Tax=Pleurodeles waltl TaxID=8319 RepID=A0AAV7TIB4_PLEWA|nr:hypothetical protein NDU88_001352 [Pleurodeles waltl]
MSGLPRVLKKKTDSACERRRKKKNANNEKERSEEAEDGSRNGNSEVPLKINGQPWTRKRAKARELCHVPGGTWLTKPEKKIFAGQEGPGTRERRDIL